MNFKNRLDISEGNVLCFISQDCLQCQHLCVLRDCYPSKMIFFFLINQQKSHKETIVKTDKNINNTSAWNTLRTGKCVLNVHLSVSEI